MRLFIVDFGAGFESEAQFAAENAVAAARAFGERFPDISNFTIRDGGPIAVVEIYDDGSGVGIKGSPVEVGK